MIDKRSIFLTGYMGAGKSTIGKKLAKRIEFQFVDTDKLLVDEFSKPISKIFSEDGEPTFRDAELRLVKKLSKQNSLVISTGGGTLVREETLTPARENGWVVYLRAPIKELYERVIFSNSDRPMLNVPNAETQFTKRFEAREPYYNRAHITLDTFSSTPDEVVNRILATPELKEYSKC